MLCLSITNARRTGDLINMTLSEFQRAQVSESDAGDHVVFVSFHKTSQSEYCRVNVYCALYKLATDYVAAF